MWCMKKTLVLVALLELADFSTMAMAAVDERAKKFATGYELLNQHKYQEARNAFEADLQQHPTNVLAHFYLGEACRGLKAWACAEEHYQTLLELDPKSSVAPLATQRGRKAKVWRLLDEGRQAITDPDASPTTLTKAEDRLDLASKLGLDDEQRALYDQLHERFQQERHRSREKTATIQSHDGSMAVVPAGEFIMGSSMGEADEQPVHWVYVGTFFMDTYQVSVSQYARFLDATSQEAPPDWSIMNRSQHQKRPIVNVDWPEAKAYCTWAGKRLPTEAEWEKAARGTDGRIYPWGNELPMGFHANMKKEQWSDHYVLSPVGMYEDGKSPYGIYDMAGNVWEWVSDWYDPDYYQNSPSQNPTGPPTGDHKVIRGGSWGSTPKDLRSSDRDNHVPSARGMGTGFRCAKTL